MKRTVILITTLCFLTQGSALVRAAETPIGAPTTAVSRVKKKARKKLNLSPSHDLSQMNDEPRDLFPQFKPNTSPLRPRNPDRVERYQYSPLVERQRQETFGHLTSSPALNTLDWLFDYKKASIPLGSP